MLCFGSEMLLTSLCAWTLGHQVVVLYLEAIESSGGGLEPEERGPWRWAIGDALFLAVSWPVVFAY